MSVRIPRNVDSATKLLERFSQLGATIAIAEAQRRQNIAQVNASADELVLPLIEEQQRIGEALEPWWLAHGAELTKDKRKSIELGGCTIGTRQGGEALQYAGGTDRVALKQLEDETLTKGTTRTTRSLDRVAIRVLVRGKTALGAKLRTLGWAIVPGAAQFYIDRIDSAEAKVSAQ